MVRMNDDLLAKLDADRADMNRSEWIRRLIGQWTPPPPLPRASVRMASTDGICEPCSVASTDVEVILDRYPAPGDIVTEVPPPPPAPPRQPDTEKRGGRRPVPKAPKPVDPGHRDVVNMMTDRQRGGKK
jgi:hypothetical protein